MIFRTIQECIKHSQQKLSLFVLKESLQGLGVFSTMFFLLFIYLFNYLLPIICVFGDAACCSDQCKYREIFFIIIRGKCRSRNKCFWSSFPGYFSSTIGRNEAVCWVSSKVNHPYIVFGALNKIIQRIRRWDSLHTTFICRWLWVWNPCCLQLRLVFLLRHYTCNYLGFPYITAMSLKLIQLNEKNISFSLSSQWFLACSQNLEYDYKLRHACPHGTTRVIKDGI